MARKKDLKTASYITLMIARHLVLSWTCNSAWKKERLRLFVVACLLVWSFFVPHVEVVRSALAEEFLQLFLQSFLLEMLKESSWCVLLWYVMVPCMFFMVCHTSKLRLLVDYCKEVSSKDQPMTASSIIFQCSGAFSNKRLKIWNQHFPMSSKQSRQALDISERRVPMPPHHDQMQPALSYWE
jgi:hypothetical protein